MHQAQISSVDKEKRKRDVEYEVESMLEELKNLPTRRFGDGSFNEELKSYERFAVGKRIFSAGTTS